jgi:hypothetical protein
MEDDVIAMATEVMTFMGPSHWPESSKVWLPCHEKFTVMKEPIQNKK